MTQLHIPFEDLDEIARYFIYKCTLNGSDRLNEAVLENECHGLIKGNVFARKVALFSKSGEVKKPWVDQPLGRSNDFIATNSLLETVSCGISKMVEPYYPLYILGPEWLTKRYAIASSPTGIASRLQSSPQAICVIKEDDARAKEIITELGILSSKLKTANNLGRLTEEEVTLVDSELRQLKNRFEPGAYRSSSTIDLSRSTLQLIEEKAAGTLLATAANAMLSLILGFFGLTI